MELIPTEAEVAELLRHTGGLRSGHFEYPTGLHVEEYLQVALTMRDYQAAKILSVALSRRLRSHSDVRALLPEVSVVCPATGGLPVAYGVSEALRARKVYWAERETPAEPFHFRQFLKLEPGEKVILVDDVLRTGSKLTELRELVQSEGGEVVAMAVMIYQPSPNMDLVENVGLNREEPGKIPLYYLAELPAKYMVPSGCSACRRGEPVDRVSL